MADTYLFRRSDNDRIVEVGFEEMMRMDSAGFLTLADGVVARRCAHLEKRELKKQAARKELNKPIVSDALGFTYHQLQEFESDRVRNGFVGTEFTPDPRVDGFYQVRFTSQAEKDRYMKHRGDSTGIPICDQNSRNGSGGAVPECQVKRIREKLAELYPDKNSEKILVTAVDD